jgi:WD40 repeat protein
MKRKESAVSALIRIGVLAGLLAACQLVPTAAPISPLETESLTVTSTLPPPAVPSRIELLTQLTIGKINRMALSPDGSRLAVVSASGLYLYQETTLELIWGSATSSGVTQVIWSADGSWLGGVIEPNTLAAWDAHTGNLINSLEAQTEYVFDLRWLPSNDRLSWLASDTIVRVWNPNENLPVEINTADLISADIEGGPASFTPDLSLIAISGWKILSGGDYTIGKVRPLITMEVATGKSLYTIEDIGLYSIVTFSPDGSLLITGSSIRNPVNGGVLRTLEGNPDSVRNITFSPDGTKLSAKAGPESGKAQAFIWDLTTGKLLHVFEGHDDSYHIMDMAWSPDGSRFATGSNDKTVIIWDVKSGEQIQRITKIEMKVIQVEFSSDGNSIFVLSEDSHIVAWDIRTGTPLKDIRSVSNIRKLTWSPNSALLAGGGENNVFVWGSEDQKLKYVFDNAVNSETRDLQISPDGSILGILLPDSLVLRDIKTGEVLNSQTRAPSEGARSISSFAWSPDGKFLATGWEDGRVILFDSHGGEIVRRFDSAGGYDIVSALVFSPDGRKLAAGTARSTTIWSVENGEVFHVLGNQPQFDTIEWSADGRMIAATGLFNNKLEVWNAETGSSLFSTPLSSSAIRSIAWSPVKPLLSFTDGTSRALIWNAESGETRELIADNETFWLSHWSANGTLLATSASNNLLVWDTSTWKLFQTLPGSLASNQLAFSPDGKMLATGSWGGVPSLWEILP